MFYGTGDNESFRGIFRDEMTRGEREEKGGRL